MAIANRPGAKPAAAPAAVPAVAAAAKSAAAKPGTARAPLAETKPVSAAANSVTTRTPTIEVTRQFKDGGRLVGEDQTTETLQAATFLTTPGEAAVLVGRTANFGNMEFVRVDVRVTMPCYAEEVSDAVDAAGNLAWAKLQEQLANAEQQFPRGEELPTEGEVLGSDEAVELSDTTEAAEAAGDELTVEEVMAMTREEVIAVISMNAELGIDPDAYPDDDDLKGALIEAAGLGDPAENADAGDDAEDPIYTEETLKAMSADDLKEIYKTWEMGDYPKGPAPVAKNKAIKAILKIIADAAAG